MISDKTGPRNGRHSHETRRKPLAFANRSISVQAEPWPANMAGGFLRLIENHDKIRCKRCDPRLARELHFIHELGY